MADEYVPMGRGLWISTSALVRMLPTMLVWTVDELADLSDPPSSRHLLATSRVEEASRTRVRHGSRDSARDHRR